MALRGLIRNAISAAVRPYGYEILDESVLYDWQKRHDAPSVPNAKFPDGAEQYLTNQNPKLVQLRDRYAKVDAAVTTPTLWTNDHMAGDRLRYFRGDDAYVWQLQGPNMNVLGYALTTYYVRTIDTLGLLSKLSDDEYFGNWTFRIDGRIVSRDLLDSLIELYFLEKHLGLSSLQKPTILDIGAGYGRLAHRIVEGLPNVGAYMCVDGVAASTFVSEYYLRFRGCDKAQVVALDQIDAELGRRKPDIAVNIHSFSECRPAAIDWWLSLLEKHGVRFLMIVPNAHRSDGGQTLRTNEGDDFSGLVAGHGYKLVVREPKYRDQLVQRFAINPTFHFLFERS